MKKLISVILLFTSITSYADDPVVFLDKDQPAPFSGFLFSPEREKKLRLIDTELYFANVKNAELEKLLKLNETNAEIMMKRVELYQTQNEELAKRVVDLKDDGMFTKVGFFVLGAVVTGAIAYGVYRSTGR